MGGQRSKKLDRKVVCPHYDTLYENVPYCSTANGAALVWGTSFGWEVRPFRGRVAFPDVRIVAEAGGAFGRAEREGGSATKAHADADVRIPRLGRLPGCDLATRSTQMHKIPGV